MKIIYILPSLKIRGIQIILDQINGLTKRKHEVLLTSLDEPKNPSIQNITALKLDDAKQHFEDADVIIGYTPVCAFYVNDIDSKARKYYLVLNDERKYYSKDYIKEINKLDGVKLDIEHDKQQRFIEASYKLPMRKIVPNTELEKSMNGSVSLQPIDYNQDKFYPEEFIPKTGQIRVITDGTGLPWVRTDIVAQAVSELHDFELWTLGEGTPQIRTDKHWGNLDDDTLRKIFSSVDIFVTMAEFDGVADLALKAMKCGCVVVTRETSGANMFCKDAKNCIIISGKDDEELVKALTVKLKKLMKDKDLRETLIRGGLELEIPEQSEYLEKILKRK